MMSSTISSRLEGQLEPARALLERAGARLAYVFGSAAHGLERPDSDLDVAVLLSPEVPQDHHGPIRLQLTTELVGLTHTNDVDVVVLNQAPPLLAFQVISTGRLILGERRERVEFEVRTIQRYIDSRPLRERIGRAMLDRLGELSPRGAIGTGKW